MCIKKQSFPTYCKKRVFSKYIIWRLTLWWILSILCHLSHRIWNWGRTRRHFYRKKIHTSTGHETHFSTGLTSAIPLIRRFKSQIGCYLPAPWFHSAEQQCYQIWLLLRTCSQNIIWLILGCFELILWLNML